MKYVKKLIGDRIYLSPRSIEDAEIFVEWMNDFETTDYTGRSHKIMTLEAEKKYLEENINAEANFSIVTLEDNKLIGTVGIEKIDHTNRTGTLGIFIGDKNYRNNGYGTEAIKLILEYGFHYLNLNNIELTVMEFNERAIKCYEKCGFKKVGQRRKCKFINNKYYDIIIMDILAEEFEGDYIRNKNI